MSEFDCGYVDDRDCSQCYEYRSRFAIDELDEAVKRAKKCLTGSVILAEVNKILECERGNEDEKELCDNAR